MAEQQAEVQRRQRGGGDEGAAAAAAAAAGRTREPPPDEQQEEQQGGHEEEDEDPSLSSAAQCVRLVFLGSGRGGGAAGDDDDEEEDGCHTSTATATDYGPTYVHQIFDGEERIRGYVPPRDRLLKNRDRHSSYSRRKDGVGVGGSSVSEIDEEDEDELDVRIRIAPSCRSCSVDVRTRKPAPVTRTRTRCASFVTSFNGNNKKRRSSCTSVDDDSEGGVRPPQPGKRIRCSENGDRANNQDDEDDTDDDDDDADGATALTAAASAEDGNDDDASSEYDPASDEGGGGEDGSGDDDDDDEAVAAAGDKSSGGSAPATFRSTRLATAAAGPRMSVEEIRRRLARALPRIVEEGGDSNNNNSSLEDDYLDEPIGTVVDEYDDDAACDEKGAGGRRRMSSSYCLAMANGADDAVAAYHNQVQRLSLLFIETADEVDVACTKDGGSWDVMYLFRKEEQDSDGGGSGGCGASSQGSRIGKHRYALAGYMTLFAFQARFRKPTPGTIIRICQALLLPPYQRSGHGRRMLHAAFDYYGSTGRRGNSGKSCPGGGADVVEFNVEDPAPAFVALRNCVDYERFLQKRSKAGWRFWKQGATMDADGDGNWFAPLSESQARTAADLLKITTKQVYLLYEIDRLRQLEEYTAKQRSSTDAGKVHHKQVEELEKRYRLMVKKRLNKSHREDMGACRTKKEMQDLLSKLYDESVHHYRSVIASVRRWKLREQQP